MIFCDNHFEVEFLKIERWVKFICIPFFTLMSFLFITEYPFYHEQHILKHIIFSFLAVFGIWYSVRMTSNFIRKKCFQFAFAVRLSVQLFITTIISVAIV